MLRVKKRDGRLEKADFNKTTYRIQNLALGKLRDGSVIGEPLNQVSCESVAKRVINQIADGITTYELDEFAAKYCASLVAEDYQYGVLGGRISASNHQKNTIMSFSEVIRLLYENKHPDTGQPYPILKRSLYKFVMHNSKALEEMIDPNRDFRFDYFGFETLKNAYLLKRHDDPGFNVTETPQHMYMRISIALNLMTNDNHETRMKRIKETYDRLSLGKYSHASPTMFNAGTHTEQLSSCYLLGIADSMVDEGGIPDCWKACALISKVAGGIGIGIQPIRSSGTLISGTGGKSDGIIPMLRVFNDIARYVNQGGRRPGAIKVSIEPWHADIFDFLDLKKNIGLDERRARDLDYALWVPDLFMKRLEQAYSENERVLWSLMCPHKCPGLYTTYGTEFEQIYEQYETEGKYIRQVDIRKLWSAILTAMKETGEPDIMFKDSINRKNNQSNLGVIRNSNLCAEILEYSDENEYAVCNLCSISLVAHVKKDQQGHNYYDFNDLIETCKLAHRNLDNVIDINMYPVDKCRLSNLKHRPVGMGTQGLADAILELDLSYEDTYNTETNTLVTKINPKTRELNLVIAECMYYACIQSSMEIARNRHQDMQHLHNLYLENKIKFNESGLDITYLSNDLNESELETVERLRPIKQELDRDSHWGAYSSFVGSPISQGKLQYHLWDKTPVTENGENSYGIKLPWQELIDNILKYGVRNSLVRADMPTATTAQILGNSECTEPYKYIIYTRRVTAGEFVVVNKYLHCELQEKQLWNNEIKRDIVKNRGSIQKIKGIPQKIKDKYRTAFEISKKTIQILAADRGAFIDQTQSMNYFIPSPRDDIMTNVLRGAWKMGLKTGMYYLRREKTSNPIQFTVENGFAVDISSQDVEPQECISCSA